MRSAVIIILFQLLPFTLCAEQQLSEIKQFLASRQVIGSISYSANDVNLTKEQTAAIDRLVPKLRAYLQQQDRLVRIEGFSSRKQTGTDKMQLSLQRSLAVKDFLREKYQLQVAIYLTGFGENWQRDAKLSKMHRVDIAVYKLTPAAKVLFDEAGNVERYKLQ